MLIFLLLITNPNFTKIGDKKVLPALVGLFLGQYPRIGSKLTFLLGLKKTSKKQSLVKSK